MIEEVEVINIMSGDRRKLRVGRYVKNSFLILWPMSTPIEIRKQEDGRLTSNPKRFFAQWKLSDSSDKEIRQAIAIKKEEVKQMIEQERLSSRGGK